MSLYTEWQFIKQLFNLKLILFLKQLYMTKYKNTIANLSTFNNQLAHLNPNKQSFKKTSQFTNVINNANPTMVIASTKIKKLTYKHVYLMYSRIQNKLHLKFSTLFKAMALFKTYEQQSILTKQQIPQPYLLIICLNISMKYEQIYPPKLKKVIPFLKINSIDASQYCKYELAFIQMIHADLNLPTAKTIMDSYLPNQEKIVYWYSYYLLELSFMEEKLLEFTLQEICLGIVGIMTKLGITLKNKKKIDNEFDQERINYCSRIILRAKYKSIQNQSAIYKKYCKEIYGNVAQKIIYIEEN